MQNVERMVFQRIGITIRNKMIGRSFQCERWSIRRRKERVTQEWVAQMSHDSEKWKREKWWNILEFLLYLINCHFNWLNSITNTIMIIVIHNYNYFLINSYYLKQTYLMCGSAEDQTHFILCVWESTDSIHVLLSFTMKLITHYNYIAIPSKNK